jgi:hypothetical protein
MGALGMPVEAAKDLRTSTRGCCASSEGPGRARPGRRPRGRQRHAVGARPLLLGRATDVVFRGLQASGAAAIDFDELRRVLLAVLALYLTRAALSYLQAYLLAGVVQRTMERLRATSRTSSTGSPSATSTASRGATS